MSTTPEVGIHHLTIVDVLRPRVFETKGRRGVKRVGDYGNADSQTNADLSRLSLNQVTTRSWGLPEAVECCVKAACRLSRPGGTRWASRSPRRRPPLARVRSAGSQPPRRRGFPGCERGRAARQIEDNRRALEEAAELGADNLTLRAGPAPDRDIDAARAMVEEGVEQLIPYAEECGVKLAVEPLHPALGPSARCSSPCARQTICWTVWIAPSRPGL